MRTPQKKKKLSNVERKPREASFISGQQRDGTCPFFSWFRRVSECSLLLCRENTSDRVARYISYASTPRVSRLLPWLPIHLACPPIQYCIILRGPTEAKTLLLLLPMCAESRSTPPFEKEVVLILWQQRQGVLWIKSCASSCSIQCPVTLAGVTTGRRLT